MTTRPYGGAELDLFSQCDNWRAYCGRFVRPYLGKDVLEVGAGIGSATKAFCGGNHRRWVCLEPDPQLNVTIQSHIGTGRLPGYCESVNGVLADLPAGELFETILYLDVLEHIENDREELTTAAALLKSGGVLVILAPAYQWLYTPFDRSIGHYRRYSRHSLAAVVPPLFECVELKHLDSAGMVASLGNRFLLRRSLPSRTQLMIWDRVLISLSRIGDPLVRYRFGKSLFGAWRKK